MRIISGFAFIMLQFCGSKGFSQSGISQYIISSSGQSFHSAGFTYSATLGEAIIYGGNTEDVYVCQGFQSGQGVVTIVSVDFDPVSIEVQLYPNPTPDVITIQCAAGEALVFDVFNLQGQRVTSFILAQDQTTTEVSLGHCTPGVYAVFVNNQYGQRRFVDRIVLLRS